VACRDGGALRVDAPIDGAHTPAIVGGGGWSESMSKSRKAGIVLVIAVAALAVAPIDALAQRMGGGARSGGQGGGSHGGFRGGSHQGGPGGRSFAHRRFGGGFVVFAPPFWYGSDFSYDPGSAYPPAAAYGPAVYPGVGGPGMGGTLALAPSAQSTPSVIEYPTGRWELRGDGFTIPYRWVWIPNPPSAPPSPTSPSGEPGAPAPPTSSRPEPPGNTKIYRWTDGQGVLHLTDRLDTVPERYRAQARASRPS
jgi:hypothetical protein